MKCEPMIAQSAGVPSFIDEKLARWSLISSLLGLSLDLSKQDAKGGRIAVGRLYPRDGTGSV